MRTFDSKLQYELNNKYVTLTLSNKSNYTTSFVLQGVQVNMLCGYNSRNRLRWIVLKDSDGYIMLSQTFLKFGKRCELNFTANLNNLNYYVTLKPKVSGSSFSDSYKYLNWATDFEICFVGYAQSLQDRLDSNKTIVLVGS